MAPSQPTPALTEEYLAQTLQPNIYAACIIPFVLATACVIARVWCRWSKRAGYKIDDILILFAWCALVGIVGNALRMIPQGLGLHIQAAGPNAQDHLWLGWFVGEITYTTIIIFVKFSILALYYRTFAPLNIKWEIVIMSVVTFLWGAAVYICMMLHCVPLRKYWDHEVPGECNLNDQAFFFAISIPNILIDIALLILPIRYILKLEMGKRQKQAIASLFLFGGFVCVASILRLVSVMMSDVTSPDSTWVNVGQCSWAIVECNFAVISACLPCLGPIFAIFWPSAFAPKHRRVNHAPVAWTIGSEPRKNMSDQSKDPYTDTLMLTKTDEGQSTSDAPEGCIKVNNEWTVEADTVSNSNVSHSEMPWVMRV